MSSNNELQLKVQELAQARLGAKDQEKALAKVKEQIDSAVLGDNEDLPF